MTLEKLARALQRLERDHQQRSDTMKLTHYRKLTVLAAAVGLACGSFATASEDEMDKYDDQPKTSAEQRQSDFETDREYMRADQANRDNRQPTVSENATRTARSDESSVTSGKLFDDDVTSENKLSKFDAAIGEAGLSEALKDGTEYTVFAPTDDAFEAYSSGRSDLTVEELRDVVRSHIVAGRIDAEQAETLDSAMVLTGDTIAISKDGDNLEIGDTEVVSKDIRSGNLTVYVIDGVLEPSKMETQLSEDDDREEAE
jgi:uncharacterized surface protein with fasciclin (FAS1) repeats